MDEQTQKIALGLKQLTADPWQTVETRYEPGQVHTGRVTRVTDFGAFVELEPGVEALAHVSTFAPTGHSRGWAQSVPVGTTAPFEMLSIDLEKKRIGVALVPDGSTPATASSQPAVVPGARADGQGRASREVRCVRVSRAWTNGSDAARPKRVSHARATC